MSVLYLCVLPLIVVLPMLLIAVDVLIRTSSAGAVVYTYVAVVAADSAAAVAATQRVVCSAAAVQTGTNKGSVCFLMFGVLSLHFVNIICLHLLAVRNVAFTDSVRL